MRTGETRTVAIIGGGATGVSLLAQLLDAFEALGEGTSPRILIFERSSELGRGVAYSLGSSSSILNMGAATMSPYPSDPEAFLRWLIDRGYITQRRALQERSCVTLYPPRALFGDYLAEVSETLLERAAQLGIVCMRVRDEVRDLLRYNDQYLVCTRESGHFFADWTVLCTGHLSSNSFPQLNGSSSFFSSPYPEEKLRGISPTATVGIMGTRLSGVDSVLALEAQGHQGRYLMFSRTGRLPAVRSLVRPSGRTFKFFDELLVKSDSLTVTDLMRAFQRELRAWCGKNCSLKDLVGADCDAGQNLDRDINRVLTNDTAWQDVFVGLDPYVEDLWSRMDSANQERFERLLRSKWACLRHPMPLANALKMQALMRSGRLVVVGGSSSPELIDGGILVRAQTLGEVRVDALIDATGPGYDVRKTNIPLLQQMLRRGQLRAEPLGGLSVVSGSGRAISATGEVQDRLFVVGPQTRGSHFYTNAMDRNALHASRIVAGISQDFRSDFQETSFNLEARHGETIGIRGVA